MKQKLNITTFLLFWCITALWSIPRPEYPRPQFERMDWVNLNGEWTCSFDFGGTGMERESIIERFDPKDHSAFLPGK